VQAIVDRDACIGFGLCVETAPGIFRLDDEGKSVPIPGVADGDLVLEAIVNCPRDAISPIAPIGGNLEKPGAARRSRSRGC
jgi:ferredoxin